MVIYKLQNLKVGSSGQGSSAIRSLFHLGEGLKILGAYQAVVWVVSRSSSYILYGIVRSHQNC